MNQDVATWSTGTYYGDASGGTHTQFSKLRRCGCGVTTVSDDGSLRFGLHFNLPGSVQTVGRGELFALVVLAQFLEPNSSVVFYTDNLNVYRTYNK